MVPDIAGIPRGKILPARKFLESIDDRGLRLPESIFIQTVTGTYASERETDRRVSDVYLAPVVETVRSIPWYDEPAAQIIHDPYYFDGSPVDIAPRHVLRRVLDLYAARGWRPVVAPELEFFLVKVNEDPDYPLEPPVGRSGRPETARQAYGIDAVNEFDPLFEDIYDHCEAQGIDIDTLSHEAGAAQMEINFNHGDAMGLADQAFLFKRTVRQTALDHKVYATFMAKPMQHEPGSSLHVHQSVHDVETGRNIFAEADGRDSDAFRHFIGGLRRYLPAAMPLLAPYVNSYRRLVPNSDAPINVHWGYDNRTTGLRVPVSGAAGRRVENRVAGADANPYLAIAASLACGYLGMVEQVAAREAFEGDAYSAEHTLPRSLLGALNSLEECPPMIELLGREFVDVYCTIKHHEFEEFMRVVTPWERENLLLTV